MQSNANKMHKKYLGKLASPEYFCAFCLCRISGKTFWHYHIGYCKKQGNAKFTGTGCNSSSSRKGFGGTDFDATIPERICTG